MNDEIKIKNDLVLAYRILAHLKLDDHTYTHLSARSIANEGFYIYPFGQKFQEVTADNLMLVSFDGEILEGKEFQYNRTGYIIHGAIYKQRADLNAVFHLHTPHTVAVSAMKDGLLPISQWALHFYNKISYMDYDSLALQSQQGQGIASVLGGNNVMLLRNHGSLTCGKTLWEALFYTYHLELACQTQCLALSANTELVMPKAETCSKAVGDLLSFEKDLGRRDWEAWARILSN